MTGPGHVGTADVARTSAGYARLIRGAANGLQLAAAPTFAAMALLTAMVGGGAPGALCASALESPLGGMTLMYLLMTVFHATPWLRLVERV